MALTEMMVKKARVSDKSYKMGDGNGLWLKVTPTGSKLWHFRFTFGGKESVMSFGSYPTIGLKEARDRVHETRREILMGINPVSKRRESKRLARFNNDNSFRAVAKEWYDANIKKWSPDHARRLWRRLDLHVLPALGSRPVADITSLELLDAMRKIEQNKTTKKRKAKNHEKGETTHRALQACRAIFRFGVLTQKIKYNPAHDLEGALKTHKSVSYATIGHNRLPEFFERLEAAKTSQLNRLAVKMLILTFVRQGELRRAKWADIDFRANEWRVRPETTKMRTLHHVPLSTQTVAILSQISKISGASDYVFPNQGGRKHPFMSENTINDVIHGMEYKGELVGHGFRSLASTVLNENGFRADVIERQLAHMPRDKVRAAYNRAEYLSERRQMMQWWGDYLNGVGLN